MVARLAIMAGGVLLVLAGCGSSTPKGHVETPTGASRAAILHAVESAFFSTTGDPPDLRLTGLEEVAMGSTAWARATFGANPDAPTPTRQALAGGHDEGLLRQAGGSDWTWLGYLTPGRAACRTAGPSIPGEVGRLLGLPPVCGNHSTPSASPPPSAGVAETTLTTGDQATLLSIFVTAKNSGPSGQVLTPTTIRVSGATPPRAALIPGAEWAMVTYTPVPGAPEPLTRMQLQDGSGTAFFLKQTDRGWVLRGLAGRPYCNGAGTAQVPPSVLTLWGHRC